MPLIDWCVGPTQSHKSAQQSKAAAYRDRLNQVGMVFKYKIARRPVLADIGKLLCF